MTNKNPKVQIQFINQSLSQAQTLLNQAKTQLKELEDSLSGILPTPRDLPGIIGKFDGTYLVTDDGKKFQVPENYASKSKLVFGDTLKMIEDASGSTFKQIERVKRTVLTGMLAKKDGKFVAITADGSHLLIPAAVSFHKGQEGDEIKVIVPEDARNCSFATLDVIPSREVAETAAKQVAITESLEKPETKSAPVVESGSVQQARDKVPAPENQVSKLASRSDNRGRGERPPRKQEGRRSEARREEVRSITLQPPKPEPVKVPEPVKPLSPTPVAPGTVSSILQEDDLR